MSSSCVQMKLKMFHLQLKFFSSLTYKVSKQNEVCFFLLFSRIKPLYLNRGDVVMMSRVCTFLTKSCCFYTSENREKLTQQGQLCLFTLNQTMLT